MKPEDADAAWTLIAEQPTILEGFVRFDREFSVILARTDDGEVRFWACPDNVHRDGILSLSTVPAGPLITAQADEAKRSEESRVGKECVSTCRSRGSPYH